jgi:protein-S-isoprenylcysteine O-methyltransferase Ste14
MRTERAVAWTWVAGQAAILALIILLPAEDHWSVTRTVQIAGRGLEVVGLALGIWAATALGRGLTPSPLPNGRVAMVTRGPYRWVRHPMYTAVMTFMAGVVVLGESLFAAGAFLLLVVLLWLKSRWEEQHLAGAFPGYRDYAAATGRFLPRVAGGGRT